ncbi:MAG: rRNA maturation RNase YbeY [Gammaproteobacteria bacterium]|nr:rRNA maturation RNase YbeY [Gammaproteobacteria bacterium]
MQIKIFLQIASKEKNLPNKALFQHWANAAFKKNCTRNEVTIRLVDNLESKRLNLRYRHKNSPTNVLSFPFAPPKGIPTKVLGDLVISVPLVKKEARQQKISQIFHFAHLTIHGILHLLGYDHQTEKTATRMEKKEAKILQQLKF